jgi:hypothetical protein
MIEKRLFGGTGHMSSRTLFGGAAFKLAESAETARRVLAKDTSPAVLPLDHSPG